VLTARGHTVAWIGHEVMIGEYLPADAELLSAGYLPPDARLGTIEASKKRRGLDSIQFLWTRVLIPLGREMQPAIETAIAEWKPDVLVVDQQAIGGALCARRAGIRWASSCTTPTWGIVDVFGGLPKVKAWIDAQFATLEVESGLEPIPEPDRSPYLVVVFSTRALVGPEAGAPNDVFVGPAIVDRPDTTPFPWSSLGARPCVFVSLGTVSADTGGAFYAATVEALRDFSGQVIVAAPPECVPHPPPHFIVQQRVPQLALLPHVDLVVCHAGNNTVCEALSNALPLVVAPIRDDQPLIADQVVRAGVGLRLRYGRVTPSALREAIDRVLAEPEFRHNAERVRDSFRAAGGAAAAADALEALAAAPEHSGATV